MERPPYEFRDITHFSVRDVEKYSPRCDEIRKLRLEVALGTQPDRYSLVLLKPFLPLGRPGADLDTLRSLGAEDIDSILVSHKQDDEPWARIEIRGKPRRPIIFVRCERIEGVPG